MKIVIIGAGGHGRVVLEIIRAAGEHEVVGFIDADPALAGRVIGGVAVLGQANALSRLVRQGVEGAIVAIGENRTRQSYFELVLEHELRAVNAVHPAAVVSLSSALGRNIVVAAGAVVGTEAGLEDGVLINTAAVVEHECRVGPSAHVAPGAVLAGRVRVGARALVGLGARVIPCMCIGDDAVVGAGAVVVRDVLAGATVVGVPAKPRERS